MKQEKIRKIAVLGYYGYGNLGDEMCLSEMVRILKSSSEPVEVTVISGKSHKGYAPKNARIINGRNPTALFSAIASCDMLIAGGGTLLQNTTGEKSLIYYTSVMRLAAALGKEVRLYGGVGPISGKAGIKRTAAALNTCSGIYVRDRMSEAEVIKISKKKPVLAADPIFLRKARGYFDIPVSNTAQRQYGETDGECFAVQIRRQKNSDMNETEKTALSAAKMCRYISKSTGVKPVFVSMQDDFDFEVCSAAAALSGGTVISPSNGDELFSLLSGMRAAVGMRLHFLLAAGMCGIPSVAISYDTKIDAAAELTGISKIFSADGFSPDQAGEAVVQEMNSKVKKSIRIPPSDFFTGACDALYIGKTDEETHMPLNVRI